MSVAPARLSEKGGSSIKGGKADSGEALPEQAVKFASLQAKKREEIEHWLLWKKEFGRKVVRVLLCRCRRPPTTGATIAALPGKLSSWDKLQFSRPVKWLDAVGEPEIKHEEYDPTKYPKSVWGAVATSVLRLAVLVLVVWYLIQLFSFTTLISQGSVMQLNAPLPGQAGQQIDVPTVEFSLHSLITFYEADSPSLQRIDVQDMTGYNPTLVSRASKVPLSTAFYASSAVQLNSFDSATQTVDSSEAEVQLNMKDRSFAVSTHSFAETIKVLYEEALVYPTDNGFYNHTAIVYARIPQTALRAIKPCQAQLILYNKAVYDGLDAAYALDDRQYQTSELFPGLVSSDELWRPASFGSSGRQNSISLNNNNRTLFRLSSRMTTDVMNRFASNQSWGLGRCQPVLALQRLRHEQRQQRGSDDSARLPQLGAQVTARSTQRNTAQRTQQSAL